jgi:phospholipid/cholesterol/gamma-HCH transport system substrate-binding protein
MAENKTEVAVGAGVLAVAVGFFIYGAQATGFGAGAGGTTADYAASFRAADGIAVGTEVRMAGVRLGSVTALDLNPQTFRADAVVTVPAALELPDDSALVISSEGLLGGNFVEIVPGGSPFALEDGGTFTDTQGSVSLVSLMMKFVSGSGE